MKATDLLNQIEMTQSASVEIYHETKESRSINWSDHKVHSHEVALTHGTCLRVLKEGAQGVVTSQGGSEDKISSLAHLAYEMAHASPKDTHRQFHKGSKSSSIPPIPHDSSVFQKSNQDIIEILSSLEKEILGYDGRIKKIIKLNFIEELTEKSIANTNKVNVESKSSAFGFLVEVLADHQGQTEVGWDYHFTRFQKDLDMKRIAMEAAKSTVESLGGKAISSGDYPVIIHPRVGSQLLRLVTEALSAEAVQLKRSFWRDLKGKSVASSQVQLWDDPQMPGGLGSSQFDDEGVPQEKIQVVQNGILVDYFYDIYTASKDGRTSNGRGIKNSLGAIPKPGSTNFYMSPGSDSVGNWIQQNKKVFYLKNVMGLHMVDPITGEFSLGASGVLYEEGVLTTAVRGVTVAGTLKDLLLKIKGVGFDLTWVGAIGVPSLLVEPLTVSGL